MSANIITLNDPTKNWLVYAANIASPTGNLSIGNSVVVSGNITANYLDVSNNLNVNGNITGNLTGIKKVRKSTDQSVTSSTTLVNDSQLFFAVASNETYILQLWLFVYAADGVPDIKVTCLGPTGSTLLWSSSQVIFLPDGTPTLTTTQTSGQPLSLLVDANNRAIQLYGTILNGSTAGNLQFQFAQNTSSANAITVKAGSSIFGILV